MHLEYIDDESMKGLALQLAEKTAKYPYEYLEDVSCEFLDFSSDTRVDAAIYAFFVVRTHFIDSIKDDAKALLFDEHYLSEFVKCASALFAIDSDINFSEVFSERAKMYTRILNEAHSTEEVLNKLFCNFDLMIKADIILNCYPLGLDKPPVTPLPQSVSGDDTCYAECKAYDESLSSLYAKYLRKLLVVM